MNKDAAIRMAFEERGPRITRMPLVKKKVPIEKSLALTRVIPEQTCFFSYLFLFVFIRG
jgi:hypothetical protein